ncbi:MAG: SpoIIE family protein phosphatase [Christensenella sp.]|nr:SpoIIE family protein phosphatase [Christensenella sp.]
MTYLKLGVMALIPVLISVSMYLLDKKTSLGKLSKWRKQALFGVVFGILAILETEFGVAIPGAVINVRDAAPLCAGLIFGGPAGIIAGLIGGIERWFAVLWGAGEYTRLACSISTILAGCFGACIRKLMLDDKKPMWYIGFFTGFVMEVFHMLMIFFTNMSDVQTAFSFVKLCSVPMILTNALSVMLAVLFVSLIGKEKLHIAKESKKLSQAFSRWLLIVILVAFGATSLFTFILQTKFSADDNVNLLTMNIADVKADIEYASNANLLKLTHGVAEDLENASSIDDELLAALCDKPGNDFSEINVINKDGIITHSTNPGYIGFDMASGEQSNAFDVLLHGQSEHVQNYQPISKDSDTYMKYAGAALKSGGFVQVGYNAERFRKDIDEKVIGATQNRHVGETGYIMIVSDDFSIVSSPNGNDSDGLEKAGIYIDTKTMPKNTRFQGEVYGTDCFYMYDLTEGYYIIAVQAAEEVLFSRDLSVYVTVFMEIIVFAVLFILVYFLIKKLVVENINKVNKTLGEITNGNLNVVVDVRANQEFVSLSDDINSTVVALKGYIAEAAARIDKELEVAKIIQSSSLPSVFPPFPDRSDIDIYAMMTTAKEVGGDFYDFYLLDKDRLAFLIADVSGKGITAAMFMMKAKTLIKSYADKKADVSLVFTRVNEDLFAENKAEMFVTCWMGILDLTTNILSFCNAGHNPPVIRRKGSKFEYLKSRHSFVLGGIDGIKYRQSELALEPGDEIFLYTDGVTEAINDNTEMYGDDRLLCLLNTLEEGESAREICTAVKNDVDRFVGEAPQFDDITMLLLRILPRNIMAFVPIEQSMATALEFVEETIAKYNVPMEIAAKVNIAAEEIYSNIVRYSTAQNATIECAITNTRIKLIFTDDGKPYDPTSNMDPDITLSAEERNIGGLGIYMVKKIMDEVTYEYRDGLNILTVTKNIV